jgi:phospholipid/cholesterol/gamma-HCH transport system permease protein
MLTKDEADASAGGWVSPALTIEERESGFLVCRLSGDWITRSVAEVDSAMRKVSEQPDLRQVIFDLSRLGRIDTAGAWLIEREVSALLERDAKVEMSAVDNAAEILLAAVRGLARNEEEVPRPKRRFFLVAFLELVGRTVHASWTDFLMSMHILGSAIRGAQMKLGRGRGINPASVFTHIDRMGIGALPIVVLMSAIVGAIVAQQGAFQLRYFGAEIFVVDLVAILVWRELGVLLTAIMIAGRSGSAITAEIGSMKMREEVDALTVIGLNPVGVLVLPRLLALVIALPCLTIAANFAAIGGAMLVSYFYSGISPTAFLERMRDTIDLSTVLAGLIKAPFMAMIIGIVASVEGMQVGGSAESLGRQVTNSVVKSIFIVIVVDGLFAMFYAAIDF